MFPLTTILSPLAVLVSLTTATGVFVHDSNIDKVTTHVVSSLPSGVQVLQNGAAENRLGNMLHDHVERASFSQAVRDINASSPRIQPRNEDKKYVSQKNAMRGDFLFDNYNLPIA